MSGWNYVKIFSPAALLAWPLLFFSCMEQTVNPASGKFIDKRDKHEYQWVTIGTQTWMAENLAWLPAVSPPAMGSDTEPFYYVFGYDGTDVNAARRTNGFSSYGVFYNWVAAMNLADSSSGQSEIRGVCPEGWHMPTDEEWDVLVDFLGGDAIAGKKMKSTKSWKTYDGTSGKGDNSSGFNGLPAGSRNNIGVFYEIGYNALFWSSTQSGDYSAWYRHLGYNHTGVNRYFLNKSFGFSVRCVQDI